MKKPTPSLKKRRIAKAHLEGKTNSEIAAVEYPDTKTGEVMVSRALHDDDTQQFMEQTKLQALKKYNIGYDRIVGVISDAMDATIDGDIPNHNVRLSAIKQAREMLQTKEWEPKTPNENPLNIPSNMTEKQLIMILKSSN